MNTVWKNVIYWAVAGLLTGFGTVMYLFVFLNIVVPGAIESGIEGIEINYSGVVWITIVYGVWFVILGWLNRKIIK